MYALDTNAIIYYLKNDQKAVSVLGEIFSQAAPIYISTITEVELFGFPNLSPREMENIEAILQTLSIIPLDSRIARIAGSIRSKFRLKTSDSVIAATALFTNSQLLTRNIRDFKKISDLLLQEI